MDAHRETINNWEWPGHELRTDVVKSTVFNQYHFTFLNDRFDYKVRPCLCDRCA